MDENAITNHVNRLWDESIVPELKEYIRIPNKSVAFDPEWAAHGHMDRVVARFEKWARNQPINRDWPVLLPRRPPRYHRTIHGFGFCWLASIACNIAKCPAH